MRKLSNQRGLTLVEILAAIVIASIIAFIIFGIQSNSKEQYNIQAEKNAQLTDISYALKIITKDIRKSGTAPIITETTMLSVIIGSEEYVFDPSSKTITRNGGLLVQRIIDFKIYPIKTNTYLIQIENEHERVKTEITIRS